MPVPAFLAAIVVLWAVDPRINYDSPSLTFILNFLFATTVSLVIAWLVSRSFLEQGRPGLLFVVCGVAFWSASGVIGGAVAPHDVNIIVTIHNSCAWLSAACHLVGVLLSLRASLALRWRRLWLGLALSLSLLAVALVTVLTLRGWLPTFFVQGHGGTLVRQSVLGSAILMFSLSSVLLRAGRRGSLPSFAYWYALALLLIAVGLGGVMLQAQVGSLLNWTAKVVQNLGGVYMLVAAMTSLRAADRRHVTFDVLVGEARYGYGVAVAVVLAATALRLEFLQSLEGRAAFVTFFPTVMLAALYGGLGPGLLATGLSALLADYFWIEPTGRLGMTDLVAWVGSALFLAGGAMASWLIEAMHRARRRSAEAEVLRASERRFRALAGATFEGIAITEAGRYVDVNEQMLQILGRSREEVIGREVLADIPAEERGRVLASIREGHESFIEHPVLRKDGTRLIVEARGRTIDYQGHKVRFTAIRDVSRQKRAEEAIRQSEERYRQLYEVAPIGIGIATLAGRAVAANPAMSTILGYTPEQIRGVDIRQLYVDPAAREQLLADLARDGSVRNREVQLKHRDGGVRYSRLAMDRIHLPGEAEPFLLACLEDITDRRKAEEAFRVSSERYHLLAETMLQGVVHQDSTGKIIAMNPAAQHILGKTPEEFLGCSSADHEHHTIREDGTPFPAEQHPSMVALRTAQPVRSVVMGVFNPRQARYRWIRIDAVPVRRPQQREPHEVYTIFEDITDQRKAEAELRASQQDYRRLFETADEGIWLLNAEGKTTVVNPKMAAILGYEPDEMIGRHLFEFMDGEGRAVAARNLDRRRQGIAEQHDFRFRHKDGSDVWTLVSTNPIFDAQGRYAGTLGMITDITLRKQAEQDLKALNETLEQRVAARTAEARERAEQLRALALQLTEAEQRERQRIADVLHEHFQQLLVGARFCLARAQPCTDPREVRESLQQADRILTEAVEASRSLAVELCPPILRQAGLAPALAWLGQWMRERHGLRVDVSLEPHLPVLNEDVQALLFQAMRELLFNVVKHAGTGRARLEVLREPEGVLRLTVSDAGVGFDGSSAAAAKATGLGLKAIQERIAFLGGRMDIQSKPGEGARISLVLPMPRAVPAATVDLQADEQGASVPGSARADAPISSGPASGSVRVLLADDHAIVRDGIATSLEMQSGIEVVGRAADGREAVNAALILQPDVVIMDVSMPGMDGKEATRRILASLPNTRIIGLSMFTEPDVAEAMRAAGAVAYLAKASGPDALVAAIRECTRQIPAPAGS